jgi:REP element-mobilizing transposase RayT
MIGANVLMNNHFHLLVQTPNEDRPNNVFLYERGHYINPKT